MPLLAHIPSFRPKITFSSTNSWITFGGAGHNTKTENIRSKILELHETGPGAEYSRGSLWGAVNAISEFTDHVQNTKDPQKRLNSVWFGAGERLKLRAFDLARTWLNN